MVSLILALALAQTEPPLVPTPEEPPPEARLIPPPEAPPPPSPVKRSLLSAGGGALGGPAALGIAMLLVGANPRFDSVFASGALASLLITGVAFTLHQALGGHGEITLSFLACAAIMAGSAAIALAANPGREIAPYLTIGIGSIPAAVAATLALEGTTPQPRKKAIALTVTPAGVMGTF
jgi:hypothetical protein